MLVFKFNCFWYMLTLQVYSYQCTYVASVSFLLCLLYNGTGGSNLNSNYGVGTYIG